MIIKQQRRILPKFVHIRQHLRCGGIPVLQFMGHSLHDDLLHAAGDIGIERRRHNRTAIDMLNGNRNRGFSLIRRSAAHHFVHHNAQRINI